MKASLSEMLAQVMAELLSVPRETYTTGAQRKLDDLRKLLRLDDPNNAYSGTRRAQPRKLVPGPLLH